MRRAMASAADLPVEIVEEIFLLLDDAADLLRASAACASFRRVVSNGGFLRRFRSLHRRPVLGLLRRNMAIGGLIRFHPAEPPRRSGLAAGLSSSFLPAHPTTGHCWHVHDARGGRVLLLPGDGTTCMSSLSDLVVYDPLHRKHVQIPPIPNDLVARHGHYCSCQDCECQFNPFLVPAADDEDDFSFRVMCTVLSTRETGLEYDSCVLESFVYSSVTGEWRGVASLSEADYYYPYHLSYMDRHYAYGCFYWVDSYKKDMVVLDMNEMKFSVVSLPPGAKGKLKIVAEAAEEDRIVLLVPYQNTLQLYTKAAFGAANDCWQWRQDAVVTLLNSYEWYGGDADQGYALLHGVPRDVYLPWARGSSPETMPTSTHYFTVKLQTLAVEQLCVTEFDTEPAFLYAS